MGWRDIKRKIKRKREKGKDGQFVNLVFFYGYMAKFLYKNGKKQAKLNQKNFSKKTNSNSKI